MGCIKEPIGINLIVDSTPLTRIARQNISEIIAYYNKTGRKKKLIGSSIKTKTRIDTSKKELI